ISSSISTRFDHLSFVWGAHASRVLANAPRVRELSISLCGLCPADSPLTSPHEENHFHERSAGGDRTLFAGGPQRKFSILQWPDSTRPEIGSNRFRRHRCANTPRSR